MSAANNTVPVMKEVVIYMTVLHISVDVVWRITVRFMEAPLIPC